jgi:hypothetical protein
MAKWVSCLLILGLLATGDPVYRLMLDDGQVIAYTEFQPHVGDYYWQAEADTWYVVVRVEGDIGWLELTEPPAENPAPSFQPSLLRGTLVILSLTVVLWVLTAYKRPK